MTVTFVILDKFVACVVFLFQTLGHLMFSLSGTAYMWLAVVYLEEPSLMKAFGREYYHYMQRTPRFIPSLWNTWRLKTWSKLLLPIMTTILIISLTVSGCLHLRKISSYWKHLIGCIVKITWHRLGYCYEQAHIV